jgi:hypothetical protein
MVSNKEIAELFDNMASLLEMKGDSIFKIRAYRRAARIIEQLPTPLDQAIGDGVDLMSIPGIGKAISSKIEEMVSTGKVATYERLKGELSTKTLEGLYAHSLISRYGGFILRSEQLGPTTMSESQYERPSIPHQEFGESPTAELVRKEPEAVWHLKQAIRSGREWHLALLEAMGMWTIPEEEVHGRHYIYLVLGEAFDWLILAERLCGELDGLVPTEEKERLLFQGRLPDSISTAEFQDLIGHNKHRAFLNYWYGVVVEEALQLAVEEEVRKQHCARGFSDSEDLVEEAFMRIYDDTRSNLVKEFLNGKGDPRRKTLSLTETKELTYQLFKRRLKFWDPARVASDTRKGLERLSKLRAYGPSVAA